MTVVLARLFLIGCLLASPSVLAQSFPERNVTIIVTSTAGALTDVLARAVGQRLSQMWNQTVVVENKAGAAYSIAATTVTRSAPDGYTLLATENGMFTIQPHLAKGRPYAPSDFAPVINFARIPMAPLANPSLPAKSVGDLIALAKAKPGTVSYGTAGPGTAPHMAALLLERMAGIKMAVVHYRGVFPALNDVIAGHINTITMGPSVALPAYRGGKLAILGIGSPKRIPQLPNVPATAETVPGYEAGVSFGLYAPAATPPQIVAKINADVQKIMADPAFREKFYTPQMLESMASPPAGFAQFLDAESQKWARVIRDANLKID